ncbi:MAG: acetoacetate--CoA ligase [Rhodospirillaceae bacterium]|nr:acetoacetate--CoA ligase [Rhodospirillaceae bacterium]MBT5244471.1 acetoacetate--CoA ligase [Rhodospirillaceae bacterium]MBT5560728.1 acetoacetate--CoA ligase [Rhodospirillaceae bacterium]MBT6242442.1 acetoacetate--CoA ligase [Rhodospirillaceae bacterium]MBT7136770.1 acetoacetate--CoA ligase [Rhodospirillaceae bacterium]
MQQPLWQPGEERISGTNITAFIRAIEEDWNVNVENFDGLYEFSITEIDKFWMSLKDFGGVIAETWGDAVQETPGRMPGTRFFPDARLNFAENLLRRRDDSEALVFRGEDKVNRRLSFAELYDQVSLVRQALINIGVTSGDRVGAYLPNMPEAIIAMLATSSLGAIWSSCSPDFGVKGVLDRFGQIEPKVIFAAEGYHYNGKSHDCLEKLAEIVRALPSVEKTVVVPYTRDAPAIDGVKNAVWLGDLTNPYQAADIDFERFAFNHPLYIMYSSGTTGAPKCIVHGAGGSLLQHIKEHQLHCDIKPGDRVFYFTTCGWMMWNWLVTALASQATLILYDGSPFYPDGNVLFDYADAEKMTLFGTSAKFIDAAIKAELEPAKTHSLQSVRLICSTGSPLAPDAFTWVYDHIKRDVHLASIAGGTDLMGCFMLGDPTGPVWKGEIQARALGMAVDVFDDDGQSIRGEKGELVCTLPFPSMPIGFYKDDDGSKYHSAYFERFDNVWCHGDYVELTEHGGVIIYGRSDATLNPGGVRIGTAEIYRQVEKLSQVVEAIVIGQQWDNDVRVVLFIVLREGLALDEDLINLIRSEVRANCTPRHVPAKVIQVSDIPRTKSGKITELAVRDVIHGRPVKNKEALANPEALTLFENLTELQD